MKLSYSWLKDYLDFSLSPEELSEVLTLAGLEAEGFKEVEDDIIFDIGLTPNLGHCMSVIGIARELSAILKLRLKRKEITIAEGAERTDEVINVVIEDDRCLRYGCRLIKGIKVGPSPSWLQKRLEDCGLRSVNNVVDVGNLVMLECGQPLHIFDYDKIAGDQIIVKGANPGKMVTLDESERLVEKDLLVVCDSEKPIAFAGVMGDLATSVSGNTVNVLIEAAHFTPEAVRKTSKVLNLRSESSLRFERGIDPLFVFAALDFAAALLKEVAGGEVTKGAATCTKKDYKPHLLDLNPERANRLLGTDLTAGEMANLLKRLEFSILSESDEKIRVEVPSYRNDVRAEIDVIEEVGRLFGFNNIPRSLARHISSTMTHSPLFLFEKQVREKLMSLGLQECLTCDLISPKLSKLTMENAMEKSQVAVLHPASIDQSILRTTLLPGLLEVVKFNCDRQNNQIAAFEVGHIHFKDKENYTSEPVAGILLTGRERPYHFEAKPGEVDFFSLKGIVENFLDSLGFEANSFEISHLHNFHPNRQAGILLHRRQVGVLGEVHPGHLKELGVDQRVFYAECNLHALLDLMTKEKKVTPLPAYPGSERDWTITLDNKVAIATVIEGVLGLNSPLLENIFLLDLYKSEKIGKDKKNATFRFQYRDKNKTIEFAEVEKEHKRLTESMAEKFALV